MRTRQCRFPTPINCRETALPCPDDAEFVEVEFSDLQGRTYALEALSKSQLMILHHSPIAETRWLKTQPSLQQVVVNS